MNHLRKLLPCLLVLIFLVSACGTKSTPTTSVEAPTASESTSATAAETVKEAILRVGWSSEPDTLNPLTTYSTEGMEVISLIYDKLLSYNLDMQAEPSLAKEYSYSDDGLTITYVLRDGVKWQDGQPLTADDVVFTFNFIFENQLGSNFQWLMDFESATAVDAQTAAIKFSRPQAFNPGLAIPILPKHIWGEMTAGEVQTFTNDNPVGSGPFTLTDWTKGATVTLSRNPDFWGDPAPESKIVYVLYGNEDVMVQALKTGDIDIVTEVPPTIWDGLQNVENVKAVSLNSYSFHHIGFNLSDSEQSLGNPLLRDVVIRQALNYAVDRNQLVEIALAGHGKPGGSIIPIGLTEWHLDIPTDKVMNGDPEKAKAILEAAGYTDRDGDGVRESPDGALLSFRLIAIESTTVDVRAAELFRDAAATVGIQLTLQTVDENTMGSSVYNVENPDWDIFVWGWDSTFPDADYLLGVPLCSQIGGNNDVFYCDETYDAMYSQQATELDATARKTIVDEMQLKFYQDAAYIVMWYQDKLQAYRTDTWQGWKEIPGGIIYNATRDNYLKITPVQ